MKFRIKNKNYTIIEDLIDIDDEVLDRLKTMNHWEHKKYYYHIYNINPRVNVFQPHRKQFIVNFYELEKV